MTRLSLLACLVVMLTGCGTAPASTEAAIEAEVIAARDRVWRAYFEGDSAALARALPERMVGMDEQVAEIIRNAQAFRAGGGRLVDVSFRDSEFVISAEMALVISDYRVDYTMSDSAGVMEGRAIELFTREGERWVNPFWHLAPRAAADSTGD